MRFPGFTEVWERKKLGEIANFYSGGTPLTSIKKYYNGSIPFIRSGDINSEHPDQYITNEGLENSSAKMVEVGDILYALYGATSGEVGISKIKGAINQAILCIKSKENNYFIYSYLLKRKRNILNTFLQGGQGNLSAEIIKQIDLTIPTKGEQKKIAFFLSLLDERIQAQSKIIEQLETLIKGLCQKLILTQPSNIKLKYCVSCNSSSLTESDVINKNGIYPVYGASGIISFIENYQINQDSILIIKDGSGVGKVQFGEGKYSVIGTLNYLIPKPGINLKYIFYCLKFFNFEKYKVGSGIPHIYFKDYGESLIFCPSFDEQCNIEQLLSAIEEKTNIEKTILKKYENKKKDLLKNLFI